MFLKDLTLASVFVLCASGLQAQTFNNDDFKREYQPENLNDYVHQFLCVQKDDDGKFVALIDNIDFLVPYVHEEGYWDGFGFGFDFTPPGYIFREDLEGLKRLEWIYKRYEGRVPDEVYREQMRQLRAAENSLLLEAESCYMS